MREGLVEGDGLATEAIAGKERFQDKLLTVEAVFHASHNTALDKVEPFGMVTVAKDKLIVGLPLLDGLRGNFAQLLIW